jgi:hypothetical protein
MKLAVLDFLNQDYGLNVLFENNPIFTTIDRFVFDEEIQQNRTKHCKIRFDYYSINDTNYDVFFIIVNLYDCRYMINNIEMINNQKQQYFKNMVEIIKNNNFKKVVIFDNYDYDYDPNNVFIINKEQRLIEDKNIVFFKRNYNRNEQYKSNVFPFPYLIFGKECIIHSLLNFEPNTLEIHQKKKQIYFTGTLFHHIDNEYPVNRNRAEMFHRINGKIPELVRFQWMNHGEYINEMRNSLFCLDLLGVGDPNIRTFEILSSGSLRITQRSSLKWNFDDDFCEETYFDNENELQEKIYRLINEPKLYKKCLDKQNFIISTYMQREYLSNYIITNSGINYLCNSYPSTAINPEIPNIPL